MPLDQVKAHFAGEATVYDGIITRLIPDYELQNRLIGDRLAALDRPVRRALDLGCGTGILAQLVLRAFPAARVTLVDLAEPMLAEAAGRLAAHRDRLELRAGDFGALDLGGPYDLVVSGLAIHHLPDPGKAGLFRRLFAALAPGGWFINRDVVKLPTPELTRRAEAEWQDYMRGNGMDADRFFGTYLREDLPATLADQLGWLADAGFADVACWHQRLLGAVFGGRKPERGR